MEVYNDIKNDPAKQEEIQALCAEEEMKKVYMKTVQPYIETKAYGF